MGLSCIDTELLRPMVGPATVCFIVPVVHSAGCSRALWWVLLRPQKRLRMEVFWGGRAREGRGGWSISLGLFLAPHFGS